MTRSKPKTRAKPKSKKKATKKKSKKHEIEVVNGKTGKRKKTGKKVVVIDKTDGSKPTLHASLKTRLDELNAQIEQHIVEAAIRFYEIGLALAQVRDDQLYRADGFKSFNAYLADHKHIRSKVTAYNMIAVAERLTREQAIRLGPTVSYIIARSPEEVRAELEQRALGGLPPEKLKKAAKVLREEAGVMDRSPGKPAAKVKRAVGRVNGGHAEPPIEIDVKEVRKKAKEKKCEAAGVRSGETGIVELKALTKAQAKKAGGYSRKCIAQIGEDGPKVAIYVDTVDNKLKYRVM